MDGELIEQRCRQLFNFLMQGPVVDIMVFGFLQVLAVTTGLVVLLRLLGTFCFSILTTILILRVSIFVGTVTL